MERHEYGRLSAWRDTAGIDEAKARDLTKRLELRASAEDEVAARDEYLTLLGVSRGERVLDVGCGSGVVTRAIARRVAPTGRALGVDASPALLTVARELAVKDGLEAVIELREGDCRALPFDDGSFDAVVAATVLAHVPGAERAVTEMVRVTRPGGRVGVFDFDGDSFVVAHPDRVLTRRIVAAASDHAAVNGWLVRRLPGLFRDAGLEAIRARGFMPLERDPDGFYAKLAERQADTALKVGAITADECERWLADLGAEMRAGHFIGGRLHVFVWGTRR